MRIGSIAGSRPDVVILDLHLRTGSGFGVLRQARPRRPSPESGDSDQLGLPEYRHEAESFGVERFWTSPANYFRLPSLLRGFARERAGGDH